MAAYLTSGLLCTVALSVLAYVTGRGVCLQQKRSNHFFFGIVLCSTVFLQVYLAGGIRWVAFISLPDVLLWSSLAAPFLCFTAGAATRAAGLRSCLRSAVATCLVGLALGYTFFPLLRPALSPVRLSEKTLWADDVCLQSHTATCAPAAAVTLLRRAGILAEERDLVRVCSTSDQGTPRILKRRFVLEELIGSGGMGSVYRAKDLRKVEARDNRPFIAVKVLNNDFRQHPEAFVALEREASKSQGLRHSNIVSICF